MNTLSTQGHILIVEDEPRLAAVLGDYLTASGYTHCWVSNGLDAMTTFSAAKPDLVLLDLMLPGKGGMEVCREIRLDSQTPIIMITALVEEIDRLIGLETGADDYICKPFSPREVVARIAAVLRRHRYIPKEDRPDPLSINEESYEAMVHDKKLDLTPIEFNLLLFFYNAQGRVLSRDQVLAQIYPDHRVVTDRTVDTHVKNLRRKLAEAGASEDWIKSIYGVGYKMEYLP
ncbi:response regulator [Advenella mimigardefordensis]|uniref:Two component transcriptional regulatory protein BaeR n=1 Tax=Advenella mimigardefordensis (strain DSM 17166 / LMG 22922 / DPN7) TaxID=1247726 RepID=W0P8I1_ADVMD|nr:response regulator [Advenella mimigardefordensis]AHG63046.1 two component transcriptional regulatory protein BaeR [Advenella mimigardefordensis DPN7]